MSAQHEYARRIVRHLDQLPDNRHTIFRDWLEAVEAMLLRLPANAEALRATGRPAEDPPEMQDLFRRLHDRYGERGRQVFGQAAGELIASTSEGYLDVVGQTYMDLEIGNVRAGQYFTPWDVAVMMARMTIPDGEKAVHDRIKSAAVGSPLGGAVLLAGLLCRRPEEAEAHFFGRLLPAVIEEVEPITIMDPACGSGIMLLAAAAQFPRWAIDLGLVQFFGQDIDQVCCRMARINCLLYGLRGAKNMSIAKRLHELVERGQMPRERAEELLHQVHRVEQDETLREVPVEESPVHEVVSASVAEGTQLALF